MGSAEIHIVPVDFNLITPSHGESGHPQTIITESLHATTHCGVGCVLRKEGDQRHQGEMCKLRARHPVEVFRTHARLTKVA